MRRLRAWTHHPRACELLRHIFPGNPAGIDIAYEKQISKKFDRKDNEKK